MSGKKSLRTRTLRAGAWTLGGNAAGQLFRLASNLVMTRLLAPEMFGVMAVGLVFLTAVGMFSDIGLRQVVIRSVRGEDPHFLNTVWTVQIVRGAALFVVSLGIALLLWLLAGAGLFPTGSTYAHLDLPKVLAALSVTALIGGFESTKLLSASRKLAVGRTVVIELAGQVIGFVPMVAWALWSPSVYALVCGAIIAALVRVLLGHVWLLGLRNRLAWDRKALREVGEFGRWMLVTSIMGFMIRMGDRLLLGWILSAPMLGLYAIAAIMVGVPQHIVERLMSTVALPALGEAHRQDPERMRALYYRIRLPIDAFCLIVGAALFVSGDAVIRVLYDTRYVDAGPMLEALAVSLFAIRFGVAGQFYLVLGMPKIMAMLMTLRLIAMAVLIPLGFSIAGVMGAIWGIALAPFPGLLVTVFVYKRRLGLLDWRKELMVLLFLPLGAGIGHGLDLLLALPWMPR